MANKLLLIGESGSGKTFSLRNMDPAETFYICPDEKELPFKGGEKNFKAVRGKDGKLDLKNSNRYETTDYTNAKAVLNKISKERTDIKYVVIDTITNMLIDDFMSRAKEKNWDKFTDFAYNFYSIIQLIRKLREDLTVVLLAHSDVQDRNGQNFSKIFVPGGKLTDKSKPESKMTTVLETYIDYGEDNQPQYYLRTQNAGDGIAKSPYGMFDSYLIENDMKKVLDKTHEFNNQ